MNRLVILIGFATLAASGGNRALADSLARAESRPTSPVAVAPPSAVAGRSTLEFNTGGEMFMSSTIAGSASGWAYAILHIYHYEDPVYTPMQMREFGFPTCIWSSDPIPLPVDWYLEITAEDLPALPNPYAFNWDHQGTFYPTTGDSNPPSVYEVVDVVPLDIFFEDGDALYWGYENAGLCGQIEYNGVETLGWYIDQWESDAPYGRTCLMQFSADHLVTASNERSLGEIKSLY